jgi:hypothetical protein
MIFKKDLNMKSNNEQLRSRGYIEEHDFVLYQGASREALTLMLESTVATDRTIAARVLVKYRDIEVARLLVTRLVAETKLYTKIALSESLGEFGSMACPLLVNHLGAIGTNQYKALPESPFKKGNYPIPRDIIARTICKIGTPALSYLKEVLYTGRYEQILEAIDAIGFISYYNADDACLVDLLAMMSRYTEDSLMIWKAIRALQSFADSEVIEILNAYVHSPIEQHRWEAVRSLRQIEKKL